MALKKAEPEQSEIVNITVLNKKYSGYFLKCRKGVFGLLYDFITEDGHLFTVKGNTDIVAKFSIIPEGCYCEITLEKMEKSKAGFDMKIFLIEYDQDDNWNRKEEPPIAK